jgi:hypothetical protein
MYSYSEGLSERLSIYQGIGDTQELKTHKELIKQVKRNLWWGKILCQLNTERGLSEELTK